MLNSLGAFRSVIFFLTPRKAGAGVNFWREGILLAGGEGWNTLLAFWLVRWVSGNDKWVWKLGLIRLIFSIIHIEKYPRLGID